MRLGGEREKKGKGMERKLKGKERKECMEGGDTEKEVRG